MFRALIVALALVAPAAGCGGDDEEPAKPAGATATPTPDRPALSY